MGQRTVHGTQAECGGPPVTLETKAVVELPIGTPSQGDEQQRAREERKAGGRGIPKGATAIPHLGGLAHKDKPRMVERLALTPPGKELPTRRYHVAAKAMKWATSSKLAATVGGGTLDEHVDYLVTAAARAAKWANYFSDLAERLPEGSKDQRETVVAALNADEKASSHIRNAHEYAAKMADIRLKAKNANSGQVALQSHRAEIVVSE